MRTETHWVNTQEGFKFDTSTGNNGRNSVPNTPVTYHYLQNCPDSWVTNGWVREATAEEHIEIIKTEHWRKHKDYTMFDDLSR